MTVFYLHDGTWGIGWGFPFFVVGACLMCEAIFPVIRNVTIKPKQEESRK